MEKQKLSSERLGRQWVGIRMAHEAVMLSDAQANLAIERDAVRQHHEKVINRQSSDREKTLTGREDMIHIGDTIVQPQQPLGTKSSRGLSGLAKAGLTATVVAVGGLAVGAPLAVSWLLQRSVPKATSTVTDRDTQFELKLLPDE